MLFNSWIFVAFIAVVIPAYFLLSKRWQNVLLLAVSYLFYGTWDVRFLGLILLSTVVDYGVGLSLGRSERRSIRRALLVFSCLTNLGILGFFKYFDFFAASVGQLLGVVGLDVSVERLNIILPVGISFYTFQTLSYTIDVYLKRLKPTSHLLDFALFVGFFPQLVAGPIERASSLLPQIRRRRHVTGEQIASGAWLILLGYFKKLVIADNLAMLVDPVFAQTAPDDGWTALLAVYAFAIQIYCDFSGYSDIARGVAKIMGIELMVNFDRPYLSRSPSEFWRRWHISLSTWLRDYLYIPLGGSRAGKYQTYRNLTLTMLLGGLWHGASWKFVVWGGYHGLLLSAQRWLRGGEKAQAPARSRPWLAALQVLVMFHLTCLGWLIFRAENTAQVWHFLQAIGMTLMPTAGMHDLLIPFLFYAGLLGAVEWYTRNSDHPASRFGWRWGLGPVTVSCMLMAILYLSAPGGSQFIYFQF